MKNLLLILLILTSSLSFSQTMDSTSIPSKMLRLQNKKQETFDFVSVKQKAPANFNPTTEVVMLRSFGKTGKALRRRRK